MTTYTARAVRWAKGWELHVDGVGVTQVRKLANATQQVRDLIETECDIDANDDAIVITPDLGELTERAQRARDHVRKAEQERRDAAREAREIARQLRANGLSTADTAAVLGVSRSRVSQLTHA